MVSNLEVTKACIKNFIGSGNRYFLILEMDLIWA